MKLLFDVGFAGDRSLVESLEEGGGGCAGSSGGKELLGLDVLFLGIGARGSVARYPLDFLLEIRIGCAVRMPETGDVAFAETAAVTPWTGQVSHAARVPEGRGRRSRHALPAVVADLVLLAFPGYVGRLAVNAAVIAGRVVEQHIREGERLATRRWTERSGCGCCNFNVLSLVSRYIYMYKSFVNRVMLYSRKLLTYE